MPSENPQRRAVYAIVDRTSGKPRWVRVGIAFPNKDGSMNLVLDALPINGKLHVRDFSEEEKEAVPAPEAVA